MADSDTSTDINVYDNKGKISEIKSEHKKTTDTDLYFNLLANQNKMIPERIDESSESELINSDTTKNTSSVRKSSSSSSTNSSRHSKHSKHSKSSKSTKSKNRYENMNFSGSNQPNVPVFVPPSNINHNPVPTIPEQVPLTPQEIRMKKIELLRKLAEIKVKGFSLSKEYSFNDSLEEMEYEYELLKSFADKRNGIKVYKNILLNGVSLVEFLNDKYDPFDFHLQGWGEHMSIEVDSYDDVLEDLYEKYKGAGKKMAPEIKLLLLIIASASAFHFTKSQSTIPGLDTILHNNPDLISKLINPQKSKSQFMSQQELNIEKQREMLKEQQKQQKQQRQQKQPQQIPQMNFMATPSIREPVASNQNKNDMKTPNNVQEILNRIKQSRNVSNGGTDTQEETTSNNDRILSDINVSDSKRGRRVKTPLISVNTK
jgi:hypothetical protein